MDMFIAIRANPCRCYGPFNTLRNFEQFEVKMSWNIMVYYDHFEINDHLVVSVKCRV